MELISVLQSFALAKDGEIVSVADVDRGLACDCICPACKEALVAKKGAIRIWHFAHASGASCEGGAESALHLAAKRLIEKSRGIMVPEIRVQKSVHLPDGRSATGEICVEAMWVDFDRVSLEEPLGTIKPDVIGQAGSARYLIEIAVSHFVDYEKRVTIETLGLPALEISLNLMERESWDWAALEEAVVQGTAAKAWLFQPARKNLETAALDKAETAALMKSLPPTPTTPAPRMRLSVQGRIVDLIDLPFGIAVWTPYNPEINEVIKAIARSLCGRWQPKYRNWLFPRAVRPFLLQAFNDLAKGGASAIIPHQKDRVECLAPGSTHVCAS